MPHKSWIASMIVAILLFSPLASVAPVPRAAAATAPPEADGWVLVSSAAQLGYLNQNQEAYLDRQIRLEQDINMEGLGWIPFGGNEYASFTGIFDGGGHRISGLAIDGTGLRYAGFFGHLSGTVHDLGLTVQATGGEYTGGLAGYLEGGSIARSYTEGSIISGDETSLAGVSAAGGLVGEAIHSSITRSYSTAKVQSGKAGNQYAGGLVGSQGAGLIADSFATGTVNNMAHPSHFFNGGGLVGFLIYGSVTRSYAVGAVRTDGTGFLGLAAGGFAGAASVQSSIASSYFDSTTTLQAAGIGHSSNAGLLELSGLDTAAMRIEANYGQWDFGNEWAISSQVNNGYPYLHPVILTEQLPRALKGEPYRLKLRAFNGAGGSLRWQASGLPEGMELTAAGALEGTAMDSGSFTVVLEAADSGAKIAARSMILEVDEHAPEIGAFAVAPGQALGAARATGTPGNPDHAFAYLISSAAGVRPLAGAALPEGAVPYTLGTDIATAAPGQYLQLFEADAASRIRAWSSIRLEAAHIQDRIPVTGLRLDRTELILLAGQEPEQLAAIIEPAEATHPAVSWSSSNPDIAAVDQSGTVAPIAEGSAIITATAEDGGFTAQAEVTVQPATPRVGAVAGLVYGTGGTPLPGATVSIGTIEAATDGQGYFVLADLEPGSHTLYVAAASYYRYSAEIEVIAGQATDAGRIELLAKPPANPPTGPGQQEPGNGTDPGQATDSETGTEAGYLSVKINGTDVRVAVVREHEQDGRSVVRIMLDELLIPAMFASGGEANIDIASEAAAVRVNMPITLLQAVSAQQPGAIMHISFNGARYSLPLRLWDVAPSAGLATAAISTLTEQARQQLAGIAAAQGYQLIAEPADFALAIDGKHWDGPGSLYTKRMLPLHANAAAAVEADPARATVVWVDPAGGLHFVPSVFTAGETIFFAPHNSLFTAIRTERQSTAAFADTEGHWAQAAIAEMANKRIVQGVSREAFAPERAITRAELAALLVRGLGLTEQPGSARYSDVDASHAWYTGAVGAASAAGLMGGFADGTFRPDAAATREQLAVAVARAIQFAGGELPDAGESLAAHYADHADVAGWAAQSVARLAAAQLVTGVAGGGGLGGDLGGSNSIDGIGKLAFAPRQPATRAQCAVLINRILRYLGFIN